MTEVLYDQNRTLDFQYQNLLRHINDSSDTFLAKHPNQVRGRWTSLTAPRLVYKFANGFPVITERKIGFWKKAIAELICFINGARRLEQFEAAGCNWWTEWASKEQCDKFGLEEGDLGPGSYGPVLHDFPTPDGPFNQVANFVQSLKDGPHYNRHLMTTWYAPLAMQHGGLKRQVVVAPCHGTKVQATVIEGKKLALTMNQTSGDVPGGVVMNIIQWAAFTYMTAHVCGYEPYMYTHVIDDAQIYEDQVDSVSEILRRIPLHFPTLHLTDKGQEVTNIFDFTADHFELREYHSHPAMKIPYTL